MVVLNKIYTRTGDDGTTALGTGERVRKDSLRVAAYGTVDETNAAIGVARISLGEAAGSVIDAGKDTGKNTGKDAAKDVRAELADALLRIQNDLFDLGADLCVPDKGEELAWTPLRITSAQVDRLEAEIDAMNGEMEPLKSFVLPGGTLAAAHLHVARTISRRAERAIVTLAAEPDEPVSPAASHYVNRLSDYLFVASRYVNDYGRADVLWVPGENR